MKRFIKSSLVSLLTLLAIIILSPNNPTITPNEKTAEVLSIGDGELVVSKIIDGDTIELKNGQKIRYIGIDTPETVDPKRPDMCFGKQASDKNRELVEGKSVRLEKDVSETDRFGRLLRYVYVGEIFVNDYLVREGFAHASSYPPDVKFQDKFSEAQREAEANSRGLWSSCSLNN